MKVTIVGPNLPANLQAKGTFVVHAAGCRDLDKLKRYVGGDTWADTMEVATRREAAEFIYPVDCFEYWDTDPASYIDDLWFAPCVDLPRGDE